jgi:hypothetical protein
VEFTRKIRGFHEREREREREREEGSTSFWWFWGVSFVDEDDFLSSK